MVNVVQSDKQLTEKEAALKDVQGSYDEVCGFLMTMWNTISRAKRGLV
jgi:hypothetical protein